jgi:N-acetylmuramic acid 6-phosphate etherase
MVARITGCTEAQAAEALAQGDGSVKLAAVIVRGIARAEAEALLQRHGGNLRAAFGELDGAQPL